MSLIVLLWYIAFWINVAVFALDTGIVMPFTIIYSAIFGPLGFGIWLIVLVSHNKAKFPGFLRFAKRVILYPLWKRA
jgi:hypothetical protein